ncbi:hypothetical protein [Microbacterium rhizophilus]|uniref:hypothetical protein n=1 Tax=Microbacterium rhizophilus TaxID=3138934 RepID=UPI0031E5676F
MADELLIMTPHGGKFVGDDRPGVRYTVERGKLTGWFERPGVKQERTEKMQGNGNFLAPAWRQSKLPAWEGLILTDSLAQQNKAISDLAPLLGDGDLIRLTVRSPEGPVAETWADAQLDDAPTPEVLVPGRVARYRVRMYCPGSFRYGEEHTFSSGEAASHRGSTDALPSFEVTGSMPSGYAIESSLGTFTVTQALTSGQKHTIDFADGGLVYRNGALQRGVYAHPRQLWAIEKGAHVVHTLDPVSGSGSLTVKLLDTF